MSSGWLTNCCFTTRELPGCNLKLISICGGRERLKEEANHSRLVSGRFNKQGNLFMMLARSGQKMNTSLHSPVRILKAYREALPGFSHVWHPGSLNTTVLSQSCVLGAAPGSKKCKWNAYFKKRRRGWEASNCLGPAWGSIGGHRFSVSSPNREVLWTLSKEDTCYQFHPHTSRTRRLAKLHCRRSTTEPLNRSGTA